MVSPRGMIGMGLGGLETASFSPGFAFIDRMKGAQNWTDYNGGVTQGADGFPIAMGSLLAGIYFPADDPSVGPARSERYHVITNLTPALGWSFAQVGRVSQTVTGGEVVIVYDASPIAAEGIGNVYRLLTCHTLGARPANGVAPYMHIVHEDDLTDFRAGKLHRKAYLNSGLDVFSLMRFMDWLRTNSSTLASFDARPKLTDVRWDHGVPLEACIALCNHFGVGGWINTPHQFIKPAPMIGGLADYSDAKKWWKLVFLLLNSSLHAFGEYSNETWNFAYDFIPQNNYVAALYQARTGTPGATIHGSAYAAVLHARAIWEALAESTPRTGKVVPMLGVHTTYAALFDYNVEGAREAGKELGIAGYAEARLCDLGLRAGAVTWYCPDVHPTPETRTLISECVAAGEAGTVRFIGCIEGTDPKPGGYGTSPIPGITSTLAVAQRNRVEWVESRFYQHGLVPVAYEGGDNVTDENWSGDSAEAAYTTLRRRVKVHAAYGAAMARAAAAQTAAGMAYICKFVWVGYENSWSTIYNLYDKEPRATALIAAQQIAPPAVPPLVLEQTRTGNLTVSGKPRIMLRTKGGRGLRSTVVTGLPAGLSIGAGLLIQRTGAVAPGSYPVVATTTDEAVPPNVLISNFSLDVTPVPEGKRYFRLRVRRAADQYANLTEVRFRGAGNALIAMGGFLVTGRHYLDRDEDHGRNVVDGTTSTWWGSDDGPLPTDLFFDAGEGGAAKPLSIEMVDRPGYTSRAPNSSQWAWSDDGVTWTVIADYVSAGANDQYPAGGVLTVLINYP